MKLTRCDGLNLVGRGRYFESMLSHACSIDDSDFDIDRELIKHNKLRQ